MYVEYKSKKEITNWSSFGSKINPGRNYWMFGFLCKGVRINFTDGFMAKGMPSDAGYASKSDNHIYISDSDEEGTCTLETAIRYRNNNHCKIEYNEEGAAVFVSHPDWHSHTWLTLREYSKAIKLYNNKDGSTPEPEYEAVLSAMKKLASFNYDVRIVFFFDN
jgi:hypothetical protein